MLSAIYSLGNVRVSSTSYRLSSANIFLLVREQQVFVNNFVFIFDVSLNFIECLTRIKVSTHMNQAEYLP